MDLKIVNGRFSRTHGYKKTSQKNNLKPKNHYQDIYERGLKRGLFSQDSTASKELIDFVFVCFLEIIRIPEEYRYLKTTRRRDA